MSHRYFIFLSIFLSIFSLLFPRQALAASFSDQLSDTRPAAGADHNVLWKIADPDGIKSGESFSLLFDTAFNLQDIGIAEVNIKISGQEIALSNACSGTDKINFSRSGNSLNFYLCPGSNDLSSAGDTVEVSIGKNTLAGTHQIINPSVASGYAIQLVGSGGYDDADRLQVAVIGGIATKMRVGAPAGNLHILGAASPGALVFFEENGSLVGTTAADSESHFEKTFPVLDEGIHSINIYAQDSHGVLTLIENYSLNIAAESTTILSSLILPPTFLPLEKNVKRTFPLHGRGMTLNRGAIRAFVMGGKDDLNIGSQSGADGSWQINLNPKLHLGKKTVSLMVLDMAGGQSQLSREQSFEVVASADLNADGVIDSADFQLLMDNYEQTAPKDILADINDDASVDLSDLSNMMHTWGTK